MLRAGMIKKLGSGLYTWMPLGLLTLRKVEQIVREEMNRAGALELVMPVIQPAELWQETGRWEKMGPNMLRLKDRHERDFVVGPTHEEVITDIVRKEIRSYRQLPVNFYQIQTKFRDEIRPRFGVMRAREFIMKDAYSFDVDEAGMMKSYQAMYDAYARIFTRMGLKFRAVDADIGRDRRHCRRTSSRCSPTRARTRSRTARAPTTRPTSRRPKRSRPPPRVRRPPRAMEKVPTPGMPTCEDVARAPRPAARAHREVPHGVGRATARTCCSSAATTWATRSRSASCPGMDGFRWATEAEIVAATGCKPGYLGPGRHPARTCRSSSTASVAVMADFVCGANEPDFHLRGVNFGRDCREPDLVADLRNVVEGDPSPDGNGHARHPPRHRGGPRLRPGPRLFRGHGRNLSGRRRSIAGPGDGLLRHRRHPGGGRRDRAEPRRARASSGRSRWPRSPWPSPRWATTATRPSAPRPTGCTTSSRPPASKCCSTTGASVLA